MSVIFLLPFTAIAFSQQQFINFEDKNAGFSVNIPSGWVKDEEVKNYDPETVLSYYSPNADAIANFGIKVKSLPLEGLATSEEIIRGSNNTLIETLKSGMEDFELINSTVIVHSNLSALKVFYTFTYADPRIADLKIPLQVMQVIIHHDDKLYYLTYRNFIEDFNKELDIIEEVFDSFKIIK